MQWPLKITRDIKIQKGYFWICQDPDLLNGDEVVVIALQGSCFGIKNPEEYNPNWECFQRRKILST